VSLATVIAYIGLGSNLAEPEQQIRSAMGELDDLPQSCCLAQSSLYRSAPLAVPGVALGDSVNDQPDYINAVVALETSLEPAALLAELQQLETLHQRVMEQRWGPRTLDLDLLLYGEDRINTPELTVPHPGLYERNFVLYPLAEIAPPDLLVPGQGSLQTVLARCERGELEKIA
jgi:2-amino-4-hydroxy-6-hydroxymethyldihydropteridine diphosphokinase